MNDLEMQGIIGSLDQVNLEPEIRKGLETLCRELQAVNDQFTREAMGIDNDKRYTREGKRDKKQKLGSEIVGKLQPYPTAYDELLSQAEKKLLNPDRQVKKSDTEILIDYMKNAELRRMYGVEKMDDLQIEAQSDNPLFVEAILTSPKPLLPKTRLDKMIKQRAKVADPQVGVEIDQLNFASKTIKGLTASIIANVKQSGWKDDADPLNAKPGSFVDPVKEAAGL